LANSEDNAVFPGIEFRGFLMFPARATIKFSHTTVVIASD